MHPLTLSTRQLPQHSKAINARAKPRLSKIKTSSAANKLHDPRGSLLLSNNYCYSTLNTKLPVSGPMLSMKKDCSGLTLAGCQVPTKPLYHSPPQQDNRGENKMEKSSWVKIKAV